MEVTAKHKYARISPQKCRLVADVVRGAPVGNAISTLRFMPKKGAEIVLKVLESAVANAENNNNLSADSLTVKSAIIENGPVLKRFKAGARGTAMPRRKKMSHIRIVLSDGNTNS